MISYEVMSSKKSKSFKAPRKGLKEKPNKSDPEIFVLPPNILQKLGINLDNVGNVDMLPNHEKSDTVISNNIPIHKLFKGPEMSSDGNTESKNCNTNNSILETANLMKESVLMCPTFACSTVSNTNLTELEVSSVNETSSNKINGTQILPISTKINFECDEEENDPQPQNLTETLQVNQNESNDFVPLPQLTVRNALTDISIIPTQVTSTDDHPDEAYSSDCSNSNLGCSERTNITNNFPKLPIINNQPPKESKAKINIISDEILNPTQLKELKIFYSANISNYISDSINSVTNEIPIGNKLNTGDTSTFPLGVGDLSEKIFNDVSKNKPYNRLNSIKLFEKKSKQNHVNILKSNHELNGNCEVLQDPAYVKEQQLIQLNENNIGDCIDLAVGDLEMHLKENEDTLENFVKELTSNDDNAILEKIEQTEKESLNPMALDEIEEELNRVTNILSQAEVMCSKESNDTGTNDSIGTENDNISANLMNTLKNTNNEVNAKDVESKGSSKTKKTNLTNEPVSKIIKCDQNKFHTDLNNDEKNSSSGIASNIANDRIKEIAMYLKQFVKNRPKKRSDYIKQQKKLTLPKNHAKHDDTKLKVHAHGVEKPGGSKRGDESSITFKIYGTSKKKRREQTMSTKIDEKYLHVLSNIKNISIDHNAVAEQDLLLSPQFCLCEDFGRMAYYDSEYLYEHIHFWDHKNIDCNNEILFSIYSDKSTIESLNKHDCTFEIVQNDNIKEDSLNSVSNICWNMYTTNVNVNDVLEIDQCNITESKLLNEPLANIVRNSIFSVDKFPIKVESIEIHKSEAFTLSVREERDSSKKSINFEPTESNLPHKITTPPEENLKSNDCTEPMDILDKDIRKQIQNPSDQKLSSDKVSVEMLLQEKNSQSGEETLIEINEPVTSRTEMSNSENETQKVIEETNGSSKKAPIDSNINSNNMEQTTSSSPKNKRKRRKSEVENTGGQNLEPALKKLIRCGVCNDLLDKLEWENHISKEHNFIAWKVGESLDLKDPKLLEKLQRRKEVETFIDCHMCTKTYKSVKRFLSHIESCLKSINHDDDSSNIKVQNTSNERVEQTLENGELVEVADAKTEATTNKNITCGVCKEIIAFSEWINHIAQKHSYLAWKSCENPLDLDDDEKIKQHLTNIVREVGNLTCSICGAVYKQARFFLGHIRKCKEDEESTAIEEHDDDVDNIAETDGVIENIPVCCGVCGANVERSAWYDHMGNAHGYLAWIDGEVKLDVNDEELVKDHLYAISKMYGGLICCKCGCNRKYVKSFVQHVQNCTGDVANDSINKTDINASEHDITYDNKDVDNAAVPDAVEGTKSVCCGVCGANVERSAWYNHMGSAHGYLAWIDGDDKLDLNDEKLVKNHLYAISKMYGGLICCKCGRNRKYVKSFMQHIQNCTGDVANDSINKTDINASEHDITYDNNDVEKAAVPDVVGGAISVCCGACGADVERSAWYDHMGNAHGYLAWIDGENKLDVNDEELVKEHLYAISKMYGGLICCKCGRNRKYVKSFMQHVQNCTGDVVNDSINNTDSENILTPDMVKCGVCFKIMKSEDWIQHIKMLHSYRAWKVGECLDVSNEIEVESHLESILKQTEHLHCTKCTNDFKTVESYMQHAKECKSKLMFVCAMCSKAVDPKDWDTHKMKDHYNVAWVVGEEPIDLKSPAAVEKLIKEYKNRYKMVCKNCGTSRVSCMGFYAHIIVCGKTEEEADIHKKMCDVCNKKYLCVYENQHKTYHKEQQMILERRQREKEESAAREEMKNSNKNTEVEQEELSGRRRAAQKARNVIEKYQRDINDRSCEDADIDGSCSKDFSDSDESVVLEGSENETDDSDVDSDISNEEDEVENILTRRDRKHIPAASLKVRRFPFTLTDINSYLETSAEEFYNFYHKNKKVYPEWYTKEWEAVSQENLSAYMPPLEESCRFKINNSWDTLKRFEAQAHVTHKAGTVSSLFVGCCIQTMSWSPPVADNEDTYGHYLAVTGDLSADFPKVEVEDKTPFAGLIQIWDFGQFDRLPKYAVGLAHNYGIAWSMDWCPAGARDSLSQDGTSFSRLGLLAVAFSTGVAYIFSIPYPHLIVKEDKLIYKLKPLAELRLTMKSDRTQPQATSINWSLQGNCDTIVVAYSDGTMATYDLNTESCLLKSTENGVTILHPYHDKKVLNSCVTGVNTYPSMERQYSMTLCASSLTGSALVAGHTSRPSSQQMNIACADARFQPLWPAALVATEDGGSATAVSNELEWWGVGRRLGPAVAADGCGRCASAAVAAPPLLTLLRRHPVNDYATKRLVALVDMTRLTKKRKIKNDDLQVVLEPFTYEDAVKKYGMEIVLDRATLNQTSLNRTMYPDRFPLADVTCLRFCPSPKHHNKLAVATHAGIIIVINV